MCAEQVQRHVSDLRMAVWEMLHSPEHHTRHQALQNAVHAFDQFDRRIEQLLIKDADRGNQTDTIAFLSFGKRDLEALARLTRDPCIEQGRVLDALLELSLFLDVCAPGVITAVRGALDTLSIKNNLTQALHAFKNKLASEIVQNAVRKWVVSGDIYEGNEVHHVNAYLFALRHDFNLNPIDDPLAPLYLPPQKVEICRYEVQDTLANGFPLIRLADVYLQTVSNRLYEIFGLPVGSDLSGIGDYFWLKTQIGLVAQQFRDLIGFQIQPETFLEITDADSGKFSVPDRSDRILRELLLQCNEEGLSNEVTVKFTQSSLAEGQPHSLCCVGNRGWVETGALIRNSRHREYTRPIELSDKALLLDYLLGSEFSNTGQEACLSAVICSNELLVDLFVSLKTEDEVALLADYTSDRLSMDQHKKTGTGLASLRQHLLLGALPHIKPRAHQEAFLIAQIPNWSVETLSYFFESDQKHNILWFLKMGCDPELKIFRGMTLLQNVVDAGDISFAKSLVSAGCNPLVLTADGMSLTDLLPPRLKEILLFCRIFENFSLSESRFQTHRIQFVHIEPDSRRKLKLLYEILLTTNYRDKTAPTEEGATYDWRQALAEIQENGHGILMPELAFLVARKTDAVTPLFISQIDAFVDPLWAFSWLAKKPIFQQSAVTYEFLLLSPLHHPYERERGLVNVALDDLRKNQYVRALACTKFGSIQREFLKMLYRLACGSGVEPLDITELQAARSISADFFRSGVATKNYLAGTVHADISLRLYQHFKSQPHEHDCDSFSKYCVTALKGNSTNAHIWSLVAQSLEEAEVFSFNGKTLTRSECELRSYAYTPINPVSGQTIMHTVALNGDVETFRRLEAFGCSVTQKDREGMTPSSLLDAALLSHLVEVIAL